MADHPEEMTDMDEPASRATGPGSRALIAAAVLVTIAACGATTPHRTPSSARPVAPAAAMGGSGNGQSQWFHLEAGTYRIVLKADDGGTLGDNALMRHRIAGPNPDGSFTNAQAPIVAFLMGVGNDIETLPAGDYVLVVAGVDSRGWTLTVTRVS